MAQPSATAPSSKFKNIDDPAGFRGCMNALQSPATRNFVVDFGDEEALCAVDLSEDEFKALLDSPRPERHTTRWINFYGGDLSQASIEALVAHYDISPRLISLLCSKASNESTTIRRNADKESSNEDLNEKVVQNPQQSRSDAEMALEILKESMKRPIPRTMLDLKNSHIGQIVDDVMHFCSIDWGQRYLCVGYNSLYSIPNLLIDSGPNKPWGKRIFNTLTMCDDGTVISTSEKPFPRPLDFYQEILSVVRRQTMNVFRELSQISKQTENQNSLMTVTIRKFGQQAPKQVALEHASLLFYYLFDDWISHYSLVARREHTYGDLLETIRRQMFEKADMELIKALHQIGRQVSVLKRIYLSIEAVIKNVLQRQRDMQQEAYRPQSTPNGDHSSGVTRRNTAASGEDSHLSIHDFRLSQSSLSALPRSNASVGVELAPAAIVRFERLLDRISLYALSEIEEFIKEKESLVFMNFNLISLKDSQAVESLTRNTVAISKIAAFFLPLSLMTAYFSTSIGELQRAYNKKTYWVTFAVVIVLTFLGMVVFETATKKVKGRAIYESMTRIFWGKAKLKGRR